MRDDGGGNQKLSKIVYVIYGRLLSQKHVFPLMTKNV